ncbi:MAG: hypothetical protein EXQ59_03355 [Acidobacteria bacterium]|nr:hypothetical protein [Acidobacteriota bacterium]
MTCGECGTDIADKALICYRCGHPTTTPRVKPPVDGPLTRRPQSRPTRLTIVVLLTVAALVIWFFARQL